MFDIDVLCHENGIFEPDIIINKTTSNYFVLWSEHNLYSQPTDIITPPPLSLYGIHLKLKFEDTTIIVGVISMYIMI